MTHDKLSIGHAVQKTTKLSLIRVMPTIVAQIQSQPAHRIDSNILAAISGSCLRGIIANHRGSVEGEFPI